MTGLLDAASKNNKKEVTGNGGIDNGLLMEEHQRNELYEEEDSVVEMARITRVREER
jgi:hypothetical protein